jgi:hypothetical protein
MTAGHDTPYISVVVTARNDNHGENPLLRMQAFLDSWIGQAKRYGLSSEIVVVEWNPPPGSPKLKDVLRRPESTHPCAVRFIEVPPEVHGTIPNSRAIPLHRMIAKNAGIRRARGQFVLATNSDIIFSAELMQFLAGRRLEQRAFYRMDRYDVAGELPARTSVDELLAFCKSHILRVCAREGVWETNGDNLRPVERDDIIATDSGVRLGAGWYGLEADDGIPKRYIAPDAEIVFDRPPATASQLIFDVEVGPSARDGWVELEVLDPGGAELASAIVEGRCKFRLKIPEALKSGKFRLCVRNGGVALLQEPRMLDLRVFEIAWGGYERQTFEVDPAVFAKPVRSDWKLDVLRRRPGVDWSVRCPIPSPHAAYMRDAVYLHTNRCGDFTLLSRAGWFALRAYPEFPVWPMHVAPLLCYAAHHAGIREIILRDPMRIFHIQHLCASGCTPESEEELQARVAAKGVPILDYRDFLKSVHHMRRFNVPLIFSRENWGLADVPLPETDL